MARSLILLLISTFAAGSISAQSSWEAIGKAWGEYLEYPSKENCVALYNALPDSLGELNFESDKDLIADSLFDNLDLLCYQISVCDRDAVRVGFKLFTVADGHFAETMDITLGGIIRINPQMFLEELHNHRHLIARLDGIVGNFGNPFIDRFEAYSLEVDFRVEALQSVHVDSLFALSSRCISVLGSQVED